MAFELGHKAVGEPFKPGQSGNPKGRPKRRDVTDLLWKILDEKVSVSISKNDALQLTKLETFLRMWILKAIGGKDSKARTELIERLLPKLSQQTLDVGVSDPRDLMEFLRNARNGNGQDEK